MGKYLGFPLLKGRVHNRDFSHIIDIVNSKLARWKTKLPNKAGMLTLAKSVLSAIPTYTMQNLWILKGICNRIDVAVRNFIWDKPSTHWVGWDKIT